MIPAMAVALPPRLLERAVIGIGLVLPWIWLVALDRVLRRKR